MLSISIALGRSKIMQVRLFSKNNNSGSSVLLIALRVLGKVNSIIKLVFGTSLQRQLAEFCCFKNLKNCQNILAFAKIVEFLRKPITKSVGVYLRHTGFDRSDWLKILHQPIRGLKK